MEVVNKNNDHKLDIRYCYLTKHVLQRMSEVGTVGCMLGSQESRLLHLNPQWSTCWKLQDSWGLRVNDLGVAGQRACWLLFSTCGEAGSINQQCWRTGSKRDHFWCMAALWGQGAGVQGWAMFTLAPWLTVFWCHLVTVSFRLVSLVPIIIKRGLGM